METYEQKYKCAIKQAKKELEACGSLDCDAARQILRLFPELKESEDERIKHEIKVVLANTDLSQFALDYTFADMLAWLEKQGDISPTKDELEALRIAAYEPVKNWSEKLQSLHEKLTHYKQIPNDKTDWDEEDETTLACLIGTLTWATNNNYHCSEDIPKYMCWLENLKQRLNGTE